MMASLGSRPAGGAGRPRSRPCPAGRCPGARTRADGRGRPRWPRGRRGPSARRGRGASGAGPGPAPCPRCRRRRGPGNAASRLARRRASAGRPRRRGPSTAGSRTTNSLPLPGPSLCAATVPPCISTRLLTSVRPMPSPPSERAIERSPWANRSNSLGSSSGGMPTPGVPDPDDDLVPLAPDGEPDAARRPRCTSPRCSGGSRGSARAGSGRRRAARAPGRSRPSAGASAPR